MGTTYTTAAAFLIAAVMVPMLRAPAAALGLLDHPDRRKRHEGCTPLTGGLAMFIAVIATLGLHFYTLTDFGGLILGMAVLLVMGLIDDLVDVRAIFRLVVQIGVATAAVVGFGLEVRELGELLGPAFGTISLGPFSTIFTVISMVFMINVINMADGVDGLAGGICVLLFGMLALIAWLSGAPSSLFMLCLITAAATAGFLMWNMRLPFRSRASAFMGDAGSMMLGFAAAWLATAIATTPGNGQAVYPIVIVFVLLVPSMDTVAIILRRLSQGRSPMSPDRAHLHHILRRCGLSVPATVGLIHLSVLCSGLLGIFAWQMNLPEWPMFLMASMLILGYSFALINSHKILRWQLRKRNRRFYNRPAVARLKPSSQHDVGP